MSLLIVPDGIIFRMQRSVTSLSSKRGLTYHIVNRVYYHELCIHNRSAIN